MTRFRFNPCNDCCCKCPNCIKTPRQILIKLSSLVDDSCSECESVLNDSTGRVATLYPPFCNAEPTESFQCSWIYWFPADVCTFNFLRATLSIDPPGGSTVDMIMNVLLWSRFGSPQANVRKVLASSISVPPRNVVDCWNWSDLLIDGSTSRIGTECDVTNFEATITAITA